MTGEVMVAAGAILGWKLLVWPLLEPVMWRSAMHTLTPERTHTDDGRATLAARGRRHK